MQGRGVSRERLGRSEASRWLSEALMWIDEFYREARKMPRQSFNKVFVAWKAAVVALAQLGAKVEPRVADELEERGFMEDGRVKVATSTAPRILHIIREKATASQLRSLTERMLELRREVYLLHSAFYEGPEHAGFIGENEALEIAKRTARRLRELLEEVNTLLQA